MNFVDRSNIWKIRRDTKVLKQKETKHFKEVEKCTFKPQLTTKQNIHTKKIEKKNMQPYKGGNGYYNKGVLLKAKKQTNEQFEYEDFESDNVGISSNVGFR